MITNEDNKLLQEFIADYNDIMKTMIGENYSASLVDMSIPNEINNLYESKWCEKANTFIDPILKSYISGLLKDLNRLSSYILDGGSTPYVFKNTRARIKNLYAKLQADSSSIIFPYDAYIDDLYDEQLY